MSELSPVADGVFVANRSFRAGNTTVIFGDAGSCLGGRCGHHRRKERLGCVRYLGYGTTSDGPVPSPIRQWDVAGFTSATVSSMRLRRAAKVAFEQ